MGKGQNPEFFSTDGGQHAAEKLMIEQPIFSMGFYEDDNEMRDVLAVIWKCERCGMKEAAEHFKRYWAALCAKNGRRSVQYQQAITYTAEPLRNTVVEDKKPHDGKESSV